MNSDNNSDDKNDFFHKGPLPHQISKFCFCRVMQFHFTGFNMFYRFCRTHSMPEPNEAQCLKCDSKDKHLG